MRLCQKVLLSLVATLWVVDAPLAGEPISYLGKDMEMNELRTEQFEGTVIVLAFWATWCPPCRAELPWLERLQMGYGRDRVTVVAVNYNESRSTIRRAMRGTDWKQVEIVITTDPRSRVRKSIGRIRSIPHTVVLDRHGNIAYQHTGYNEDAINALIKQINLLLDAGSTAPEADDES